MKPQPKKWLVRCVIVCAVIAVVGYGFRDFWQRQFRAYVLGLIEIRVVELGYELPEIDAIEILSLDGTALNSAGPTDTILGYNIHARTTVRAEQSIKIAELWRKQRRARAFSGMCHKPGYALRFFQHGKLLFVTTVCWECHNYTLPVKVFGRTGMAKYGFDADTQQSKELLEMLQTHAPLPKKPNA